MRVRRLDETGLSAGSVKSSGTPRWDRVWLRGDFFLPLFPDAMRKGQLFRKGRVELVTLALLSGLRSLVISAQHGTECAWPIDSSLEMARALLRGAHAQDGPL